MDETDIPEISHHVACYECGETATVVRHQSGFGEQLVIVRIDDAFYIPIDCPTCGRRQQLVAPKK